MNFQYPLRIIKAPVADPMAWYSEKTDLSRLSAVFASSMSDVPGFASGSTPAVYSIVG